MRLPVLDRLRARLARRRSELARARGQHAVGGERGEQVAEARPAGFDSDSLSAMGGPDRAPRPRALSSFASDVQRGGGAPLVGVEPALVGVSSALRGRLAARAHRSAQLRRRDVDLVDRRIALDVATYLGWARAAVVRRLLRDGGQGVSERRAAQLGLDGGLLVPPQFRREWCDFVDEVLSFDLGGGASHRV
jgi:hypothetical protein